MKSLLAVALLLATLRLPITLFENTVASAWFNWLWLFVVSFLWGTPLFILCGWTLKPFLLSLAFGITATLSNIYKTAKDFPWEAVEIFTGTIIGVIYGAV